MIGSTGTIPGAARLGLSLLIALCGTVAHSQIIETPSRNLEITNYIVDTGFPVTDVICMSLDKQGRLWTLAVPAGQLVYRDRSKSRHTLWCFDGADFIEFGAPKKSVTNRWPKHAKAGLDWIGYWRGDTILLRGDAYFFYTFNTLTGEYSGVRAPDGTVHFDAHALYDNNLYLISRTNNSLQIWVSVGDMLEPYVRLPDYAGPPELSVQNDAIWVSHGGRGIFKYAHDGRLLRKYGSHDFDARLVTGADTPTFFAMRDKCGPTTCLARQPCRVCWLISRQATGSSVLPDLSISRSQASRYAMIREIS